MKPVNQENKTDEGPVVYWSLHPGTRSLEFKPAAEASLLKAMHNPEAYGLTWRWFAEEYPELWDIMRDNAVPIEDILPEEIDYTQVLPDLDDLFCLEQVPGFNEGDFPPWGETAPVDENLIELLSPFAEWRSTLLNGLYRHYDPARKEEIFKVLRDAGYSVK
jgi:hypothetical protein